VPSHVREQRVEVVDAVRRPDDPRVQGDRHDLGLLFALAVEPREMPLPALEQGVVRMVLEPVHHDVVHVDRIRDGQQRAARDGQFVRQIVGRAPIAAVV